jgi:hypothetical protein
MLRPNKLAAASPIRDFEKSRSPAQAARAERRAQRTKNYITISVTVDGVPQLDKAKPITVKCCEGNQLVKWLSLTVSQRVCGQKPSGARRSHEHFRSRGGFVVPGEVLTYDSSVPTGYGSVIDPKCKIRDVFQPGHNKCFVRLGPTYGRDCLAKQEISAFGVPKTYLSPFAQRAFYSVTSETLQNYDALKERVEKKEEEQNALVTRWEVGRALCGKKKVTEQDVEASRYKAVMADQAGYGGEDGGSMADTGEQAMAMLLAVDSAFSMMSMCRLEEISTTDRNLLKTAVIQWLGEMICLDFHFLF